LVRRVAVVRPSNTSKIHVLNYSARKGNTQPAPTRWCLFLILHAHSAKNACIS
jgi:hypothetical protein